MPSYLSYDNDRLLFLWNQEDRHNSLFLMVMCCVQYIQHFEHMVWQHHMDYYILHRNMLLYLSIPGPLYTQGRMVEGLKIVLNV